MAKLETGNLNGNARAFDSASTLGLVDIHEINVTYQRQPLNGMRHVKGVKAFLITF